MKILVLGAGKMGSWLIESLCLDYEVAAFDNDLSRLKYFFNTVKLVSYEEIREFNPDLVINAVNLQLTVPVFREVLPYLSKDCILADITSVKNGLRKFYPETGRRFVSTHPMFGPTFANLRDLSGQSAIIIGESDSEGKAFFRNFFESFNLRIFEYTFLEHDETIAYSLSIPFASTMVFAACMKKQEAPGTTFRKHFEIAKGLFSEDDFLLSEVLFSPFTLEQLEKISDRLDYLRDIVKEKDEIKLREFLNQLRRNIH
ncbi:MAG TPA: prephenate dehydrogenase/arogenate dehydrogenase family protein [Bacteroidales bacterium]|nr:prephenate dehydrogenase/arogenate dehydrogenase family protein [Bacteroidales bacterium]